MGIVIALIGTLLGIRVEMGLILLPIGIVLAVLSYFGRKSGGPKETPDKEV